MSYRDLVLVDATVGKGIIVRDGGSELRVHAGTGGIPDARNAVARDFLDTTDGEWLWFIDTDMGFAPDTVYRLLDSADPVERPVMGALCFALMRDREAPGHATRFRAQPTLYDYVQTDDEVGFQAIAAYPPDRVVQVAGTGAACLLIHRSALEAVRAAAGDAWFTTLTHPTGDHGQQRTFSEDLSFCVRLASAGVPVFVDTAIRTTHEKGGIYLDEETYAQQRLTADYLATLEVPADAR
jgi:hypothetical protein